MVEQPQTTEKHTAEERKNNEKNNRVKATFSLLDHAVKIYNDTETYIKRGVTLFGLGTVIAGASFSAGQHLPNSQANLLQSSPNTQTSDISSQQPVNQTIQPNTLQPQIIYIKPLPSQSETVPNPEPVMSSPPAEQPSAPVMSSPPAKQQAKPGYLY